MTPPQPSPEKPHLSIRESHVEGVHDYTANGLFSPQDVGGKRTAKCWAFIRLQGGRWVREAPASGFRCGELINTGIGA